MNWTFSLATAVAALTLGPPAHAQVLSNSPTGYLTETSDTASVELGVKFKAKVAGTVTGIRFFRTVGSSSSFSVSLWNAAGAKIASGTVAGNVSAPGYVTVNFASPVAVDTNQVYTASYHAANGKYSYIAKGLASAIQNSNLILLAGSSNGGNGVYAYNSNVVKPTSSYQNSNYLVDVLFSAAGSAPAPSPTPTPTPAPVAAQSALPNSPSGVSTETADTASVELGVKFQANADGKILGVRFYRTVGTGQTFTASLFDANGAKLASGTATAGSLPGYVNVNFASAVAIKANTRYVASYHAPAGAYSYIANGFANAINSGNLSLLADGASGGNGLYAYSSSVVMPTSSYQASNYMVDVLYQQTGAVVTPAPTPTPTPAPSPTPVPSTGSGTRDPFIQPFNNQSFWNIPIGSGATYQSTTDAETKDILNTSLGNRWIGMQAMPVKQALSTDPLQLWKYNAHEQLNWIYGASQAQIRTPASLTAASISSPDGWSVMVEDNKQYYLENWLSTRNSDGSVSTNYVIRNDLRGLGYDPDGAHMGVRATGYSMLGGLLRKADLDSARIAHGIAMVISTRQANGFGARFVWPATYSDSGIGYSGHIPLGALFAIPASVNLNNIGLQTNEGKLVARALQEFGGYVSDTAGDSTFALLDTEETVTDAQIDNLFTDLNAIISQLRMVTNNSKASPGGPGTRIAAPPPELAP